MEEITKYIGILDTDNLSKLDIYSVCMSNVSFNINKFKELIKYNGTSLEKKFTYRNMYLNGEFTETSPLFYPCSTLLSASFIGAEKARNYTYEETNDIKLADYIMQMLMVYNPMDLYSIYKLVNNDSNLSYIRNDQELEEVLRAKDVDLVFFREIFKHLDFTYLYSLDASYIRGEYERLRDPSKSGILPLYIQQAFMQYSNAEENRKALKLLNLTPNRIN